MFRIGDCVAPRLLAEAIFDGHRLAREIDGADPEVALPYLRERVGDSDELPAAAEPAPLAVLPPRPQPARRACEFIDDTAAAAARIDALLRRPGRTGSWPWARGAGEAIDRGRRLAERYGARLAVSRPQVEAGRATPRRARRRIRRDASRPAPTSRSASRARCRTSSAWPAASTVVAVNRDRGARIFEYADLGVATDAGGLIDALLALGERP